MVLYIWTFIASIIFKQKMIVIKKEKYVKLIADVTILTKLG